MTFLPDEPLVPEEQRGEGPFVLRYEDISQHGKLLLDAMPLALSASIWQKLNTHESARAMRETGIIPILSRLVLKGQDGPLSVYSRVRGKGAFDYARSEKPDGSVDKLFLNMWCTILGTTGRTYGPEPQGGGDEIVAARIFAEHTFTKPFASREDRQVKRIELPGVEPVPSAVYRARSPQETLLPPSGAVFLDEHLSPDDAPVIFGLDHTDSNMHVNSLVYPRLFIEAGLRRLWQHGKRGSLLAFSAELAYRKPSFAGDRVRALVRAFEFEGGLGIAGVLVGEDEIALPEQKQRPRCYAQLWFREE